MSLQSDYSIREYPPKELDTMHLSALLWFKVPLAALLQSISIYFHGNSLPYYAGIALQPIMLFIMLAYLMQA